MHKNYKIRESCKRVDLYEDEYCKKRVGKYLKKRTIFKGVQVGHFVIQIVDDYIDLEGLFVPIFLNGKQVIKETRKLTTKEFYEVYEGKHEKVKNNVAYEQLL